MNLILELPDKDFKEGTREMLQQTTNNFPETNEKSENNLSKKLKVTKRTKWELQNRKYSNKN